MNNVARKGDWIQTNSGIAYWPLDPRVEEVDIEDIAHALSHQCRYAGHCKQFYSVAEHSVLVSYVVPPELALEGLLHDATEAYVVDVPRPLKRHLTGYAEIEEINWKVIAQRFGLLEKLPPEVKVADDRVLLAEKKALLDEPPLPWTWAQGLTPADVTVWALRPSVARRAFLQRFEELMSERQIAPR
jgi:5'-deoxynucleotidase YfbR-like HD superfamily hydrolase